MLYAICIKFSYKNNIRLLQSFKRRFSLICERKVVYYVCVFIHLSNKLDG